MPCLKLVITADDFGIGEERDDGIVECYRRGAVTRTSLLVNGLSATTAVSKARNVNLPMGLHLNLTEGNTISPVSSVATLINKDTGYLRGMFGFPEAVENNLVDFEQVKTEIKAQIDKYVELVGELPTHVDGHQHCHILPGIDRIFASMLAEYNIRWTRLPFDEDVESPDTTYAFVEFFDIARQRSIASQPVFESNNVRFADKFTGLARMGKGMSVPVLKGALLKVLGSQEGKTSTRTLSCELMVHPGYPCTTDNGGCGDGPDDFTKSHDREYEMGVLSDEELKTFYKEKDIELCAYP